MILTANTTFDVINQMLNVNVTEETDASHLYKSVCVHKHVLVAGKTEPSQVFERGLVPFNQLLRRDFSQQHKHMIDE